MQDSKILRNLYVFRGLNGLQLAQFNKILRVQAVQAGERVVSEGEVGDRMFVVKSGRYRVLKGAPGREQVLAEIGEGQHFGEISLIDRQPRSASVEAVTEGELCVLARADVQRILDAYPDVRLTVYENFLESLCERLRRANENLLIAGEAPPG